MEALGYGLKPGATGLRTEGMERQLWADASCSWIAPGPRPSLCRRESEAQRWRGNPRSFRKPVSLVPVVGPPWGQHFLFV